VVAADTGRTLLLVAETRGDLMHHAVLEWVQRWVPSGPCSVLDCGGRDINGSPSYLFENATLEVVDLVQGPGVTWVGDILDYGNAQPFDVGLYLEVAEHTPDWPLHIKHIRDLLNKKTGLFIFTAATHGRPAHSASDGGQLQPDEYYNNIDPDLLAQLLDRTFSKHVIDVQGDDVRAAAWR
jgi:hypothetical protein